MTIERILKEKGRSVITAQATASLAELATVLAENKIGVVVISEDGRNLDGVVSERDVVWAFAEFGADAAAMPASAVMTTRVYVCHPVDKVVEIMRTMTERRIRHMPVVVDEKLRGIISLGDLVRRMQRDRDQTMLEHARFRRAS